MALQLHGLFLEQLEGVLQTDACTATHSRAFPNLNP